MSNSTKDTIKDKIAVMQHYANGGEIEWVLKTCPLDGWSIWISNEEPTWDWSRYNYRIKKS